MREHDWEQLDPKISALAGDGSAASVIAHIVGIGTSAILARLEILGLASTQPAAEAKKTGYVYQSSTIATGSSAYLRAERERIESNLAARLTSPRKILTAEERAQIAAENRDYVPITKRVPLPCRRRRGWSAMAPVSGSTASDKLSPST